MRVARFSPVLLALALALVLVVVFDGAGFGLGLASTESGALASILLSTLLGAPVNVLVLYLFGVLLVESDFVQSVGLFHILLLGIVVNAELMYRIVRRYLARLDERRI